MSYLLDTHVLLWWLADDPRLTPAHRDLISDGSNTIYLSSIVVAEISLKVAISKLRLSGGAGDGAGDISDIDNVMRQSAFTELPFTTRHAMVLGGLPLVHRDPFDRMLISQAKADNLVFLTTDPRCREYDIVTR